MTLAGPLSLGGCASLDGNPQTGSIEGEAVQIDVVPIAASGFQLSWVDKYESHSALNIYRRRSDSDDWSLIGWANSADQRFYSTGVLEETPVEHCVVPQGLEPIDACRGRSPVSTGSVSDVAVGTLIAPRSIRFPRNGEGSIARAGSHLLYVYGRYEGTGDYAHTSLAMRHSADDGKTWSDERVLAPSSRQLALPSLLRLKNGHLLLSYVEIVDEANARRLVRSSSDGGANWSEAASLTDGVLPYLTGSHDRLVQIDDGRLLYPVHGKLPSGDLGTFVYLSDDSGASWRRTTAAPLRVPESLLERGFSRGFWEASIAVASEGELLMVGRTAMGRLYSSRSIDRGETWSDPEPMPIQAPTAPVNMRRLSPVGDLLLVWEPHTDLTEHGGGERWILGSLTSNDGGHTWTNYKEIAYNGKAWFSYPSIYVDERNIVHMTFYGDNQGRFQNNENDEIFGGSIYLRFPKSFFMNSKSECVNSTQVERRFTCH